MLSNINAKRRQLYFPGLKLKACLCYVDICVYVFMMYACVFAFIMYAYICMQHVRVYVHTYIYTFDIKGITRDDFKDL